MAATEVFELRVRAGSLAPVSVSGLARKVLLHTAIWHKHTNTTHRTHTESNTNQTVKTDSNTQNTYINTYMYILYENCTLKNIRMVYK